MKKEKGSITLEAAIFLSMFLIAYLAFMDLVQVARAQMILQYTLDETTKELAQNSYILTKTGIVGQSIQTGQKSQQFKGKTEEMLNSVVDFGNALSGKGNVIQSANVAYSNLEDYFSNSDDIVQGLIAVAKIHGEGIRCGAGVQRQSEETAELYYIGGSGCISEKAGNSGWAWKHFLSRNKMV